MPGATTKPFAIVTGCSISSIGFLAAKTLAGKHNFHVALACRNPEKGQQAEDAIRNTYPDSHVQYLPLDLASRASIREFVQQVRALEHFSEQGLSLLVHNAGVGWGPSSPYRETQDGLEEIVGVNHFGTFCLTQLLLEDLKRADNARVVVLSSSIHDLNRGKPDGDLLLVPDFPDGILMDPDHFDGGKAYRVSKLCNLWFTYELQRRLQREGDGSSTTIQVNAVSPGFIPTTGLSRQSGWLGSFFLRYILDPWRYLGMGVTRSPEEGAEAIVQTATSPVASKGGEYFHLPKGSETIKALASSKESRDEQKAKELWELSMNVCKL